MNHHPKSWHLWHPRMLGFLTPWWLGFLLLLEPPHASLFHAAIVLALVGGMAAASPASGADSRPWLQSLAVWFLLGLGSMLLAGAAWILCGMPGTDIR